MDASMADSPTAQTDLHKDVDFERIHIEFRSRY